MKKLLSLLLCVLLMVTMMAACGKKNDTNKDNDTAKTTVSNTATTTTTVTITPDNTDGTTTGAEIVDGTTTGTEGDTTTTNGTQGVNGTTAAKPTTGTTGKPQPSDVMTIAAARNAKAGDTVKISGVVAQITYAFGQKPAGVMLVDDSGKTFGQTCLKEAAIKTNYFGKNAYPTDSFDGNITVQEFYNLKVSTDLTTNVYTMKATVKVEGSAYYTNISLADGSASIRLYCSSAAQYKWLQEYAGQEVTVEIAPCNWNSKDYYTGCVLSVIKADGTKVYNTLNFDN